MKTPKTQSPAPLSGQAKPPSRPLATTLLNAATNDPPGTWTWEPSLEQQLQSKIETLADIVTLADQIRDPEVFRRFARKFASGAANALGRYEVTFTTKTKRKAAVKT